MARAYVNQVAQHGAETTPGTAVAATTGFTSLSVTMEPKVEREQVTPQGSRFAATTFTKHDFTEGKVEGVPSYTEAASLLRWAYGAPTTAETGVDTNAYTHLFEVGSGITRTVEFGDASDAAQVAGVFVSGVGFEWGRNSGTAKVSADLVGGLFSEGHTLTADVDLPAAAPVEPGQVTVYVDDTFATLGTTVADVLSVKVSIKDLRTADWRLDASKPSIAGSVETAPKAEVELVVEANAAGRALLGAVRSGATKYIRIEGVGAAVGDATDHETMTLDFACQPLDHGRDDTDGVYVAKVKLAVVRDADGFAHTATVIDGSATVV